MQSRPMEITYVTTYTGKRSRDRKTTNSGYYVNNAKDKNKMASGMSTFPRLKQSSWNWNCSHGPSVNLLKNNEYL